MRAPRFTNCRVEGVRRGSMVGRGEEMRGCDDCREPEGEIERRPPRLPPRVKRARLLSEKTNRILTSIHVLYLRVCVRASPRSRCLCRDGRKGEPDLFSCAAKPTLQGKVCQRRLGVSNPFPIPTSPVPHTLLPSPVPVSVVQRAQSSQEGNKADFEWNRERPRLRRVNRLLVLPPDRR